MEQQNILKDAHVQQRTLAERALTKRVLVQHKLFLEIVLLKECLVIEHMTDNDNL